MVPEERMEREKKMLSAKPWDLPTLRAQEGGGWANIGAEKERHVGLEEA